MDNAKYLEKSLGLIIILIVRMKRRFQIEHEDLCEMSMSCQDHNKRI